MLITILDNLNRYMVTNDKHTLHGHKHVMPKDCPAHIHSGKTWCRDGSSVNIFFWDFLRCIVLWVDFPDMFGAFIFRGNRLIVPFNLLSPLFPSASIPL